MRHRRVQTPTTLATFALKAKDAELTVPVSKTWPQSRLTPQLVKAWRSALEKNQPLVDPGFRFKAMVRSDGGVPRIEVDGLNMAVNELAAEDVAKVLQRCTDLAADLEPILTAKMAEERQESDAGEAEEKPSPGQQRLQQLGWTQWMDMPVDSDADDIPDDNPADYEPGDDPVEEGIDAEYGPT